MIPSKILVVDDDIYVEKSFYNTLDKTDIDNIDFCTSPEDALDKILNNSYHRVICDYLFPNSHLNGVDVIRKCKDNNITNIVIITAVSSPNEIEQGVDVVKKPLTCRKIKSLVA